MGFWEQYRIVIVAILLVGGVIASKLFHNGIFTMVFISLFLLVVAIPFDIKDRIYHDGSIKKATKLEIFVSRIFSATSGLLALYSIYVTYKLVM